MTELQLLLLIFALLYLWECICWINRGSVAFLSWFGGRWRTAHPASIVGNQSGGFVLACPLPPLGTIVVGNQYPLSVSPDVVFAYVAASVNPGARGTQTEKLLKFEEIRKIEAVGKKVRINGELFLKVGSPTYAMHIASQLDELSKAPPAKRETALKEMARERLDTKAITELWEKFCKRSANIRTLTNWLFAYLFVFTPILIWRLGLHLVWPFLAAGLLCFTITIAILFRRAHKGFYSSAEDDRFTHFLIILLSPATTIRAHDALSRLLLERFHPLAIAKVFCADEKFRGLASTILRDIRHPALPICPRNEGLAVEAEKFSRALLETSVEEFLKKNNVSIKRLLQPPEPADSTCVAYCPRCLAQFTTMDGKCEDCGGIPLMPFDAERGSSLSKPRMTEKAS